MSIVGEADRHGVRPVQAVKFAIRCALLQRLPGSGTRDYLPATTWATRRSRKKMGRCCLRAAFEESDGAHPNATPAKTAAPSQLLCLNAAKQRMRSRPRISVQ